MLKFYIILIVYFLLGISAFIFINDFSQLIYIIIILSISLIGIIVWGVSCIKSQMFVSSFNNNPNAIGKIAISFDDGPHNENTEKLLGILDKYNAKANFFLIGENINKYPKIVEKIHKSGHFIGNHSYNHNNSFPFQSKKMMEQEILKTQEEIRKITKQENIYFRPPFGVTNPTIHNVVKKLKLQVIGWSIRSFDTKENLKKENIFKSIIKKIKSGDIILLHDKTKHVYWLTEEILKYAEQNNIQMITVDKLIKNK